MKVIHCADLHLDGKMNIRFSAEQAAQRRSELLRTFTRMVDYAQEDGESVIVMAGDLFDGKNISSAAFSTVSEAILSHPQIDFLFLPSNEEEDEVWERMDPAPKNLLRFCSKWRTYRYGSVAVSGIRIGSDNREDFYDSLKLDRQVYNIVVLYGQIADYGVSKDAEMISLDRLRGKGIDYLALGHVHEYRRGQLDARGIYCYSGCMEGRDFDECGRKGFVRLDIDEHTCRARMKFIPAARRSLFSVSVDVSGMRTTQEAAKSVEEVLGRQEIPKSSLLRIELTGSVSVDSQISADLLQETYLDYFYYVQVTDHTQMQIDSLRDEKEVSLKGEFIRMVMESNMDEERKADVIRCGVLALSGEEV